MLKTSSRRHLALARLLLLFCAPLQAQVDLSGPWEVQLDQDVQARWHGPNFADYLGVPLNDAGRDAALSFSADAVQQFYHQCDPYPQHYLYLGPFGMRIWPTLDPLTREVIAWNIGDWIDRMIMTIWIDGRSSPPSKALHTYSAFTVGHWEGETLVATTTHMRDGLLTRNGIPSSDKETMTSYFTRHGDYLTVSAVIQDPVYLTEPYILSRSWKLDPRMEMGGNMFVFCTPEEEDATIDVASKVPTTLPGHNTAVSMLPDDYHIPLEASMGGAATMFPEFQDRLRDYTPPKNYCTSNCCGGGNGLASMSFAARTLMCK